MKYVPHTTIRCDSIVPDELTIEGAGRGEIVLRTLRRGAAAGTLPVPAVSVCLRAPKVRQLRDLLNEVLDEQPAAQPTAASAPPRMVRPSSASARAMARRGTC